MPRFSDVTKLGFPGWAFSIGAHWMLAIALLPACRSDSSGADLQEYQAQMTPNGTRKVTVVFVDGEPRVVDSRAVATPPPGLRPPALAVSGASAAVAAPEQPGGLTWDVPGGWKSVPPSSSMRLAQYAVPPAGGDTEGAEVAVFVFAPSTGESVSETFRRWAAAFGPASSTNAKRTVRKVASTEAQMIEITGTLTTGKTMGVPVAAADASTNQQATLLGAIVQVPDGSYYFKFLGPKNTVQAARPAFERMLDSSRIASPPATDAP